MEATPLDNKPVLFTTCEGSDLMFCVRHFFSALDSKYISYTALLHERQE